MNFSSLLTHILSFLPIALQTAIAFVILKRKLVTTFRLFFAYTSAVLLLDAVLLFVHYPSNLYASIYWFGEVLTILLGLAAILETFRHLLPPYPILKIVLRLFLIFGAGSLVAAVLMLVLTKVGGSGDRLFAIIILAERSARFVEACWLVLVIALVSQLGLNWQQYSVGIVAGFGIYSALTLAIFELRAHLHLLSDPNFVVLNSAAYNVATIIWAFYFVRPQNVPPSQPLPETNLSDWNKAITEYCAHTWYRRY
jgi:hypothetical protein